MYEIDTAKHNSLTLYVRIYKLDNLHVVCEILVLYISVHFKEGHFKGNGYLVPNEIFTLWNVRFKIVRLIRTRSREIRLETIRSLYKCPLYGSVCFMVCPSQRDFTVFKKCSPTSNFKRHYSELSITRIPITRIFL